MLDARWLYTCPSLVREPTDETPILWCADAVEDVPAVLRWDLLHSYGTCSYDLYSYGLYSYGMYIYGLRVPAAAAAAAAAAAVCVFRRMHHNMVAATPLCAGMRGAGGAGVQSKVQGHRGAGVQEVQEVQGCKGYIDGESDALHRVFVREAGYGLGLLG